MKIRRNYFKLIIDFILMEILPLTRELAIEKADEILALEHNWTEIGDEAWDINNLLSDLPLKWELSHFVLCHKKVVGYQIGCMCSYLGHNEKVQLKKIIVDRSMRKLGIGRKLLKPFLEKSLEKGIETIRFRVRTDNPAVSFYDKLGFHREDGVDRTRTDKISSYFYDTSIREVLPNV